MNKIAAYQIALEQIENEKRASYLIDTYGTCDGHMPAAYLHAFDALEKDAAILGHLGNMAGSIGKSIAGGLKGLGMKGAQKGGVKMFGRDITGRQLGYGAMGAGALGAGGLAFGAGRLSKGNNNNQY